MKGSAL